MISRSKAFFYLVLLILFSPPVLAQDKRLDEGANVVRLAPASFKELPLLVVADLEARQCTIPQTFTKREPHNVVSGSFIKRGEVDWAILCSRNGVSTILVYPSGRVQSVHELGTGSDDGYLQVIDGEGTIGFSRKIDRASIDYVKRRLPPSVPTTSIDKDGIEDIFVEKASVIRYLYRGEWTEFMGLD
ncbi:MAG: hypothetical protein KF831_09385 [Acidobacteria bacterium]|nr:hypothetical protein [Acidobacteriota bacterium]